MWQVICVRVTEMRNLQAAAAAIHFFKFWYQYFFFFFLVTNELIAVISTTGVLCITKSKLAFNQRHSASRFFFWCFESLYYIILYRYPYTNILATGSLRNARNILHCVGVTTLIDTRMYTSQSCVSSPINFENAFVDMLISIQDIDNVSAYIRILMQHWPRSYFVLFINILYQYYNVHSPNAHGGHRAYKVDIAD